MFGRFTPEIDQICKENGLTCWAIDAELYQYLGNKVSIIDVLKKADVPFIPNICAKIESYRHLMEMAIKLKTLSIVIQDQ
jgi:biotin carboxylase